MQIFLKTSNCVHCVFKHIIINVTYTPQLIIILQIMGVFFKSSSIIVHRKIGHNIILMDRVNINLCSCRPFVTKKKKKKSLLPHSPPVYYVIYCVYMCILYTHLWYGYLSVWVIMIQHVIRHHKTPITIVIMTIMWDRTKGDSTCTPSGGVKPK